jgi:hypothetical protein
MVEFDNSLVRPEALTNLLARNHLARRFEKDFQYLEGLLLEPDSAPLFTQLTPSEVQLKRAEAHV